MSNKLMSEGKKINSFAETDDETSPLHERSPTFSWSGGRIARHRRCIIFTLSAVLFIFGVILGLLIGALAFHDSNNDGGTSEIETWGRLVGGRSVLEVIGDKMKADNIRDNLMNLTLHPHIAGSDRNNKLAEDLALQWHSYGFDRVDIKNYTVLLTYPNRSALNVLNVVSSSDVNNVVYTANTTLEKPLVEGEDDPDVAPPFNAYSGIGTANGTLIYVNYGRHEDFELLNSMGIQFSESICIARYAKIFRGNKASLAQQYGCRGLIIYSDPEEYAPKGGAPPFPEGVSLPDTGLQRGTLNTGVGDILTPELPAIDGAHRRLYQDAMDAKVVPSIPVQPISYKDAVQFLSRIGGNNAPDDWQGQLNITYKIGPEFDSGSSLVYLQVNNEYVNKTIKNVIGWIYGHVEPDKLVLLGNHRDAWVFGGVDPSSGTAVLAEVANVLGQLRGTGWRPGRTLVLCSWDAEEYGLLGSSEWAQDMSKLLLDRSLAYLNVDSSVTGHDSIYLAATPLLYSLIYEATKMTKCPDTQFPTVYDQWDHYNNMSGMRPYIGNLGSGSDYTIFLQNLGITSLNLVYHSEHYQGYPVYHSVHDTFYWMKKFADPDFEYHRAVGLIWLNIALQIATTPLVPYHTSDYSVFMRYAADKFAQENEQTLLEQQITLTLFNESVDMFTNACDSFQAELDHAQDKTLSDNERRILNNKLQSLERAFLNPDGLPNRPIFKHLVFAPSAINYYAGSVFPSVVDAMFNATTFADWQEVDRQLSLVAIHLRYAAQILNQYTNPI